MADGALRADADLVAQREELLGRRAAELSLTDEQQGAVRAIFEGSPVLGQGNPAVSVHPMTADECRAIRAGARIADVEPRCGAPGMVPIYDPSAGETARDARACIDQYEFPDIPCEYPVVHVTAREAVRLCEAVGKRICDAHKWEGACAGAVLEAGREYAWGRAREEMRLRHNADREIVWAYGPAKDHRLCATGSTKSAGCPGGGYGRCGSNLRGEARGLLPREVMQVPLQITFREMPHSDSVEQYVRTRAHKLETMASRMTSCRVALEVPHRHARHGEHYRVRIDVTLPGGEIVAGRSPGDVKTYEDLYATIDAAFDEIGRRVQDFVRRERGDVKPHERARHGHVSKLFPYEGFGFLRTREGEELYFHRNSVLDGAFERMKVGDRVRFVEEAAEPAPHASTVALT